MARRIGPPKIGPKKPALVSKVRRNRTVAYGSREEWAVLCRLAKKRDEHKCRLCSSTEYLQVDHIIPVSRGGLTVLPNLWTLCDLCHSRRPGHNKAKHLILHRRKQDETQRNR